MTVERSTHVRSDLEHPAESGVESHPVLYYNDTVIDHFTAPRNVEMLPWRKIDGFGQVGDPSCGDQLKLWISVDEDRVSDIAFRTFGCPGAIATSSMLTALAKDKTIEEAKQITDDDVIEALGGIPANKRHCSLLGVRALKAAIQDFEGRRQWRRFWRYLWRSGERAGRPKEG